MIHYSFLAELFNRPAALCLKNQKSLLKEENTLYDPEMRKIKGMTKKDDMVPYYSISDKEKNKED